MSAVQSLQPASAGLEQLPVAGYWSRAVQVAGLLPTQLPLWQVWVSVQSLPSLQGVRLVAVGLEQLPVAGLHVPATWHWSRAVQVTGLLPTQLPLWQVSVCVQALPSLHGVPLVAVGVEQLPVAGLHVPATWHWSRAVQVTGLLPTQLPLWQVSVCVQTLPSLHGVPFVAVGVEQLPVAGLHVPATWHWSRAVQVTGLLPTQLPLWQVSVCVQALPSVQGVPSALAGLLQAPVTGSQVPAVWHWSEAVHTTGIGVFWQTPALQESVVQAFPSLQSAAVVQSLQPAMGVLEQTPALQESAVQGFRSLQSAAVEQIGWTVTQPSPQSPPVLV